jgi:hypothetical protein
MTPNGETRKLYPLLGRTSSELAKAISESGADGICILKGADGNGVALILSNLSAIEFNEVEL